MPVTPTISPMRFWWNTPHCATADSFTGLQKRAGAYACLGASPRCRSDGMSGLEKASVSMVIGSSPASAVGQARACGERGSNDGSEHRLKLDLGVINQYPGVTRTDALSRSGMDTIRCCLRPLSLSPHFMLAIYSAGQWTFSVRGRFVVSAAIKPRRLLTARRSVGRICSRSSCYGTDFGRGQLRFFESLGCYDQKPGYEDLESLDASIRPCYVDFPADGTALRYASSITHFGASLVTLTATRFRPVAWSTMNDSESGLPGPAAASPYLCAYQITRRA